MQLILQRLFVYLIVILTGEVGNDLLIAPPLTSRPDSARVTTSELSKLADDDISTAAAAATTDDVCCVLALLSCDYCSFSSRIQSQVSPPPFNALRSALLKCSQQSFACRAACCCKLVHCSFLHLLLLLSSS